jgi:hypothetical protein
LYVDASALPPRLKSRNRDIISIGRGFVNFLGDRKKVQKIFIKYSKKLQIVFKYFGYANIILHGGDTISSLSVSFPSKGPATGFACRWPPFLQAAQNPAAPLKKNYRQKRQNPDEIQKVPAVRF